jgi:hypothetical protein
MTWSPYVGVEIGERVPHVTVTRHLFVYYIYYFRSMLSRSTVYTSMTNSYLTVASSSCMSEWGVGGQDLLAHLFHGETTVVNLISRIPTTLLKGQNLGQKTGTKLLIALVSIFPWPSEKETS